MCGDPLRAKFIAEKYLDNPVLFNEIRGMLGYTGFYKGKRVSVMGHGMGIPSIGIYSYELFNFYDVERIIRVGTAGALTDSMKIGDMLFAQAACTDSDYGHQYGFPARFAPIADFGLLEDAVRVARENNFECVAVIKVGAPSETEMKEKKDRVDDALCATRAAIEEGIVAGGGVAYIRAISALDKIKGDNADEQTGIQIIRRAIEEPLRQIVFNSGKEGSVVVQKVLEGKGDFGYNARYDRYEDLMKAGVVDPAKVTRVALENAASIAGMFLTTECVIVEKKEDKPMPAMAPGMGGMDGMM